MSKIRVLFSQIFIKAFGKHTRLIGDEMYNRILYYLRTGKNANLRDPQTFSENILARKVFQDEYALSVYTDKYQVREYVKQTIGEEYLVPCIGIWDSTRSIQFDSLPDKFVLKATHGSGWNVLVSHNTRNHGLKGLKVLDKALKCNYYYRSREKNYFNIQPRIICEEYISPSDPRGIIDFKIFCFYGKAKFFEITYNVDGNCHQSSFYNDWQNIAINSNHKAVEPDEMLKSRKDFLLELAESLASKFEFVRVDFFLADDKTYFSELTFHSGGGIKPINPYETDLKLGSFFKSNGASI